MKLDDAAVPCSIQFDPLSKLYLLLLCSNGAISLYGVGGEGDSLEQVSAAYHMVRNRSCSLASSSTARAMCACRVMSAHSSCGFGRPAACVWMQPTPACCGAPVAAVSPLEAAGSKAQRSLDSHRPRLFCHHQHQDK